MNTEQIDMNTEQIDLVSLNDAYTAKINEAVAAGREHLVVELADEYLGEVLERRASAA